MATGLWYDIKTQFIQSSSKLTQIIVLNVAVFVLVGILRLFFFVTNDLASFDLMTDYISLSPYIPNWLTRIWTTITYAFVHFSFFHLLFNMLMLYWMGIIFTEFLGEKKIWPVYLMSAASGGITYIALYNLIPVFSASSQSPTMIGASAGVFGVMLAAATLLPDYQLSLLLIGPVRLKWIALALIILDIISIPLGNAGGHIAHLGGAFFGFVFIKSLQRGVDLSSWWLLFQRKQKKRTHLNVHIGSATRRNKETPRAKTDRDVQQRVDTILDKISKSGYESLSQDEKTFLFNYSNKK
ncbi:MAG: rhomboid family intramembrane serine protease [Bacteroidetes bacterium]|nr:rhomboid family intramembrane serine protease [Bacteroidota bacterium]